MEFNFKREKKIRNFREWGYHKNYKIKKIKAQNRQGSGDIGPNKIYGRSGGEQGSETEREREPIKIIDGTVIVGKVGDNY